MDKNAAILELFNDLIAINGLRMEHYKQVIERQPAEYVGLKKILAEVIIQSQKFQGELEQEFVTIAHAIPMKGHPTGTILRTWSIVNELFKKGISKKTIWEYTDSGERALQKAYHYAESHRNLPDSAAALFNKQNAELRDFHRQLQAGFHGQTLFA